MVDPHQRLFSHNTIQQKCAWLRNYAGFEVPKAAGPHFSQTFRLLSNPAPKPTSQSSHISLRRKSSLPTLEPRRSSDSFNKYYFPKQHKYVNQRIGEIQLPVPIFQLVPPSVEVLPVTHSLPTSARFKVNFNYRSAEDLLQELKTYQLQFERRVVNRRLALERSLRDLRAINFSPDDLVAFQHHLTEEPYSQPKGREFLTACKYGDEWTARRMLEQNRYLIIEFDSTHETALHWAAKRNHTHIIALLVKWKVQLNQRDQVSTHLVGADSLVSCCEMRGF